MANPLVTYFTCTLGQAATITDHKPSLGRTINEFLKFQSRDHPKVPAVGFPAPEGGGGCYALFSFENLYRGSVFVAKQLAPILGKEVVCNSRCVALLCPSSIDFLFTWLALMELGLSVLLIAPQCQPAAIISLCRSCGASVLLYDSSLKALALSSATQVDSSLAIQSLPWQAENRDITTIIHETAIAEEIIPLHVSSEDDVAYIHHSSGTSTGIPKPIPQTHQGAFGVLPRLNGRDAATFTTTPLYHGGIADCLRAWTSNALIWLFPGGALPITPKNIHLCLSTAASVEVSAKTPRIRYFSSVPYVLQMLAYEAPGLSALREMDLVGVGGAALSPTVGDQLVEHGVNLVSRFGSAECGFLLSSHRDYVSDKEWQYLRCPSPCSTLSFEKWGDSGLAELTVKKGWPHMAKTNRPDGTYATSDLFEPHPEIRNAWRYHSRSDSQVTLLTGKKFDPAPLEDAIRESSGYIGDVFVFGNGRQYPGAIMFLSCEITQKEEEEIYDAVRTVNERVEGHCRIDRNMVALITTERPGPIKSSKGTILRGPTTGLFSEQIDGLYRGKRVASSDSGVSIDDIEVASVVGKIVHEVLGFRIDDQDDFYQHGVDSTRSTQIQSRLQAELSTIMDLPRNVVYDCGNIEKLSRFLVKFHADGNYCAESQTLQTVELVKQYSVFDSPHRDRPKIDPNANVVVLTGATGTLGGNILEVLCNETSVIKVICLVRAEEEKQSRARLTASLAQLRMSPLANHVECVSFCLSKPGLGISPDMLEVIKREATCFIHTAWTVNFSLPLSSFTHEHILGLQQLLNLTISCANPAKFIFCSSTASVIRCLAWPIPERISALPDDADSLGYSRSKWVAEAICVSASKIKGMKGRVKIARVGQLTANTRNGVWNMREAWPLLLSTVRELKCLPLIEQRLDWLPVDVAAEAVVDIALIAGLDNETEEEDMVFHVVNSREERRWWDLLRWVREFAAQEFEIVDPLIWLEKLNALENHPAKKLSWLWERAFGGLEGKKRERDVGFRVERAMERSKAMREFKGVDERLFRKFWAWLEEQMNAGGK